MTWTPSGRPGCPPGTWVADLPDSVQVGIVLELVGRCRELTLRAHELQAELGRRVARVCPRLLGLPGCGVPTAAKIVAEVAGVGRFPSKAAFHARRGSAVGVLLRGLAAPSPLSDR